MEVLPVSFQGSGTGREKQTCSGPANQVGGTAHLKPGGQSCKGPDSRFPDVKAVVHLPSPYAPQPQLLRLAASAMSLCP